MKTCLIFPGQGSQFSGMGRSIYDAYLAAREVFATGSEVVGRDLAALCFDADAETLNRTENAQTAIFTLSAALYSLITEPIDAVAGFSLGECTALYTSGMISLHDGFRIVERRGKLMQQAADEGQGAMSAVLGLTGETIQELSQGIGAQPVNFNCPGQTVIAGTPEGVKLLTKRCIEAGAKRVVPLALSGAFHTTAMAPAAKMLSDFVKDIPLNPPAVPLYTNLTGQPLAPGIVLGEHLTTHMQRPVLWQKTVENLLENGIARFVEVGPGKTLSKFIPKISKEAVVVPVEELF